jgi:hypothetical protein
MGERDDDDALRIPPVRLRASAQPLERTKAADGAAAAEGTEAIAEAAASTAVEPAEGAGAPSGIDAIAQALASGSLDVEQARAALVADAVRAHLPADADPALVSRIRAEVEAMLTDDPVIAELLRT